MILSTQCKDKHTKLIFNSWYTELDFIKKFFKKSWDSSHILVDLYMEEEIVPKKIEYNDICTIKQYRELNESIVFNKI